MQRTPNRLQREKSPYLLQHASNPVDWYPWGPEAFEKARREDKPIFLSIGYSTCHWCHVMERESFENESVAELLNRWFVPVKVDREERPDVDRVYMTAMQAMGVGGGWPLNVFLTPDLEPFYGGTYFPRTAIPGRAGMVEMLPVVYRAWMDRRDEVTTTARRLFDAIAEGAEEPAAGAIDRDDLLARAADSLARVEDPAHGGFGRAPKFPSTANLAFLLRWWRRDPGPRGHALEMVLRQLDAMRVGGIHDHLGGGFHRYSTDREWLVPHFEKMLYDQALIARTTLDAFQITRRPEYAATARGIFDYVSRDLTNPAGAFDSAEDADSEGEEGRFYVWTPAEIDAVLGAGAAPFREHYDVTPGGNFEHGASILHEVETVDATAARHGVPPREMAERLARARLELLAVRAARIRPHRDDKVLASWNGLMISAFARGARVLGDPALADRAATAAEFVWTRLWDPATRELRRRWRDGEAAGPGQLDDYADLTMGFLDLHQATLDARWLERAIALTEAQLERFWDDADPGFFDSPVDPSVRVRLRGDYDGAELAGNSVAATNLVTLAALMGRAEWRERAQHMLDAYARRLARMPVTMPQMLVALDLGHGRARHVVIVGKRGAPDTQALLGEFDRRFLPNDTLVLVDPTRPDETLARVAPFAASLHAIEGRATAYVCVNHACRLPVVEPAALAAQLEDGAEALAPPNVESYE